MRWKCDYYDHHRLKDPLDHLLLLTCPTQIAVSKLRILLVHLVFTKKMIVFVHSL